MDIDDQSTVADYLLLGIWEAITLLGDARERCDAPDLTELLARAETILSSVVSELPALTRCASGIVHDHRLVLPAEEAVGIDAAQAPFDYGPRGSGSRDA